MLFHLTILLCVFVSVLQLVFCSHNVTLDDQDPSIIYSPRASWSISANSSLDAGWAHMLTQDASGTATVNFTGIAVYFMSPLWPYLVNAAVALDSGSPVHLDLTDHSRPNVGQGPETVRSQVVWSAAGLSNISHTLVISVIPGQVFAIVDTIIYTVQDAEDIGFSTSMSSATVVNTNIEPGSTLSSTTTSASTTSAAVEGSSKRVLPIALGATFGTLALLLILLVFFLCRGRKRPASEMWSVPGASQSRLSTTQPESIHNGSNIPGLNGVIPSRDQPQNPSKRRSGLVGTTPAEMAPDFAPASLYSTGEQDGFWQGTTAQIAQRYRSSNSYRPDIMSVMIGEPSGEARSPRTSFSP